MNDTKLKGEDLLPFQARVLHELLEIRSEYPVQRKKTHLVVMATGATVLTVTAALVIAPRLRQDSPSDTVNAPRSLFLAAQVAEAVEDTDQTVLHTLEVNSFPNGPRSRFEGWWDKGGTEHQRLIETDDRGNPVSETVYQKRGDKGILTVVDHGSRTWWTHSRELGSKVHGAPWCFVENAADKTLSVCDLPAMTSGTGGAKMVTPAMMQFRDEVAEGRLETIGREIIDGRETVHVRDSSKPGMSRDFWVDASTFRPARKVTTDKFGNRFEMTFQWLARSEENLRLLEPNISGYTHIEPPKEAPRNADGSLG